MGVVEFGRSFYDLERQRQLVDQVRENSGRLAEALVTHTTTGVGQVVLPQPIHFDSPFTERPTVSYGFVVDDLPDPTYWQAPRCYGGVARWLTNVPEGEEPPPGGEFYLGFWPALNVEVPPVPLASGATVAQLLAYRTTLLANPPVVRVTHHLTTRANSYKTLPSHVDVLLATQRFE